MAVESGGADSRRFVSMVALAGACTGLIAASTAMPRPNQWTVVNPGDATVGEILQNTLAARLRQVRRAWRKACRDPQASAEHVHQLRVSIRRSLTTLHLYHELLPNRARKKLKKSLRRIRRAAGPVRDLDVAMLRLETLELPPDLRSAGKRVLTELATQRDNAWYELLELSDKPARKKLKRRVRELKDAIGIDADDATIRTAKYSDDAAERLKPLITQFLEVCQAERKVLADYHALRIAGKRLRYSLETLAGGVCSDLAVHLLELCGELQECLGQINDAAIAGEQCTACLQTSNRRTAALWAWLKTYNENELRMAQDRFQKWWSSDRGMGLRNALAPLTQNRTVA